MQNKALPNPKLDLLHDGKVYATCSLNEYADANDLSRDDCRALLAALGLVDQVHVGGGAGPLFAVRLATPAPTAADAPDCVSNCDDYPECACGQFDRDEADDANHAIEAADAEIAYEATVS